MVEVCAKVLFRLELTRTDKERDFGMSIEAELAEDTEQEDELRVFISDLSKGGPAARKGCYPVSIKISFSVLWIQSTSLFVFPSLCLCVYLCISVFVHVCMHVCDLFGVCVCVCVCVGN